jgi:hypothetical protein
MFSDMFNKVKNVVGDLFNKGRNVVGDVLKTGSNIISGFPNFPKLAEIAGDVAPFIHHGRNILSGNNFNDLVTHAKKMKQKYFQR